MDGIATAALAWPTATSGQEVILLGHSTGANAAVHAALKSPERLTRVVLAGPTFDPAARALPTLVRRAVTTIADEFPPRPGHVLSRERSPPSTAAGPAESVVGLAEGFIAIVDLAPGALAASVHSYCEPAADSFMTGSLGTRFSLLAGGSANPEFASTGRPLEPRANEWRCRRRCSRGVEDHMAALLDRVWWPASAASRGRQVRTADQRQD